MKKFLFDPLGMNSTGFVLSAQQAKQSSNVYGSQPMNPNQPFELIGKVSSNVSSIDWKIGQVIPSIAFTVEPMFYSGGGGIFSSAKDYATYLTKSGYKRYLRNGFRHRYVLVGLHRLA